MRFKIFRGFILFRTLFIALGAFVGSILMLIKPDGSLVFLDGLLPYFNVLPFSDILFQDYIFSGIMLFLINGITNLIAFILILLNRKSGYVLGTIFGVTLMAWISIQFAIFPFFAIDLFYFIFGFLQFVCGYVALVSYCQVKENASFKALNINENSSNLVIYFSRTGHSKKIAYQVALEEKAKIYEIKTSEKIDGDLGFWWCGRFAMHKWGMDLEKIDIDLSNYSKIIIVSPIWVFRISSPIRRFLAENAARIKDKNVEIVLTHFNPFVPKGAINEINSYIKPAKIRSFITQLDHYKEAKNIKIS